MGIIKRKPEEFRFKDNIEAEGYNTERSVDNRKETPMQRNVSQGRAIAEKMHSTIDRSKDKRLGDYSTGVIASTSVSKFQNDNYNSIGKQSSSNISSSIKDFKPSNTMQYPNNPNFEYKDSPSQTLQLRSHSRGKPDYEIPKTKNFFASEITPAPTYTQSYLTPSESLKKQNDGIQSSHDLSTQKPASYSQLSSQLNLPPKLIYPQTQTSQKHLIHDIEQSPQVINSPTQPLSLNSTLRSAQLKSPISLPPEMINPLIPPKSYQEQESSDSVQNTPTSPGPRMPSIPDPQVESLKVKITELESSNSQLTDKCRVMAADLKDLRKVNSQLKQALEAVQTKDLAFEKMKRDREKLEKSLEEKKVEYSRVKEDVETFKNEFIEVARFIKAHVKPNWVVRNVYAAELPERTDVYQRDEIGDHQHRKVADR